MVRHIVFWKLKDNAEGGTSAENAARIKQLLENLNGKIPGTLKLEVGIDFSRTDASADVALYSEFESRAALDAYAVHPEHLAVKDFIGKVTAARQVVDYEGS